MKKDLQFKSFDLAEYKSDDNGNLIIKAYGAVFGNVDSYNDIIERGAFTKTLNERKDRIAFCYQHDIWNPIGKIMEAKEDETGLFIEVMISASEKSIQTKVKEGILKELSIGYRTINSRTEVRNGDQVNILTEIKLIEISLVTVAANPLAVIVGMKAEEKADFISSEFDRIIALEKSANMKFEIAKLKALCTYQEPGKSTLEVTEPQKTSYSKNDLLNFLRNGR